MPEHEQNVYPLTDLKCFTVSFTYLSSTLRPWPFCINVCLFLAAPSFVEELLDQAAAAGQCVTLSCRTAPHSSLHIRWFRGELAAPRGSLQDRGGLGTSGYTAKVLISPIFHLADGMPVHSSSRILISSTLKHFQLLTILSVSAEDFGIYTCMATSSLGSASTSCVIRKAGKKKDLHFYTASADFEA